MGEMRARRLWKLSVFEHLSSTNEYLRHLAESGAPEGTVIIAREQTAGKGRFGRRWASPKGGAWFSVLLRPPIPVEQAGCIAIVMAVSLARALRERWSVPVGVKWPNDLYVRERKLGGILIELSSSPRKIEWLIAGIGINVNNILPQETSVPATSLSCELGRVIDLEEFFDVALHALARDYERFLTEGFEFAREEWSRLSVLPAHIIVESSAERFSADVLGLSPLGKLIVRIGETVRELASEEVTLCQRQPS
ncbi:MAG: biotin--[acetyl-CoA-carboxylase] ligase [Candidatus Bipolaricaulota bacterium]|nr:biotin--[acetyl-CoA-carboxylase] ligase [Candidatus Bipolaricaulota bacterium]MDW8030228.1 biotin--[acetyl-CoA-carboxylase] ligase [Candidatus Bipolaricaulota bacterium]